MENNPDAYTTYIPAEYWTMSGLDRVVHVPNEYIVDLYAIYAPHSYVIHYDTLGGKGQPSPQVKIYGQVLEEGLRLQEPEKTGYIFECWSDLAEDENGKPITSCPVMDLDKATGHYYSPGYLLDNDNTVGQTDKVRTLYAVWSPKEYEISFIDIHDEWYLEDETKPINSLWKVKDSDENLLGKVDSVKFDEIYPDIEDIMERLRNDEELVLLKALKRQKGYLYSTNMECHTKNQELSELLKIHIML